MAILLGLASCAPPPPAARGAGWRSGARLRARVEVATDGTTRFVGWWDVALGIDCAFRVDGDGTPRCFPTATLSETFADPACTRAAHLVTACSPASAYVVRDGAAAPECDSRQLFRPAEAVALDTAAATTAFSLGSGTCAAWTFDPSARAIPLGPVAAPDMFVAATVVTRPLAGRIAEEVVIADDGAEERVGLVDVTLDARCTIGGGVVDAPICLPENHGYANVIPWRADSACMDVAAHGGWPRVCGPPLAIVDLGDSLEPTVLRQVGREILGPVFRGVAGSGTCEVIDRPDETFYELGPIAPEGTFATAVGATVGSAGARARVATIDGIVVADLGWGGRADAACARRAFSDGTSRCVDAGAQDVAWSDVYSDAACTQLLLSGAPVGELPTAVVTAPGCGDVITELRALEVAPDGPRFQAVGGGCEPLPPTTDAYSRLGDPRAFDVFPTLVETVQ